MEAISLLLIIESWVIWKSVQTYFFMMQYGFKIYMFELIVNKDTSTNYKIKPELKLLSGS